MKEIFDEYKLPIIGGIVGLVIAILLVTIGFFQTLLLIILMVVGATIGLYLDKTHILDDYLDRK
ncbi:DUF2273 domain-containing protein [Pediococcus siamensis]|uniref:DUF2273 domain-containing protein n=1 Tax=Pediococcus siamensis TaxID=381829 RepID=UPI0039A032D5